MILPLVTTFWTIVQLSLQNYGFSIFAPCQLSVKITTFNLSNLIFQLIILKLPELN